MKMRTLSPKFHYDFSIARTFREFGNPQCNSIEESAVAMGLLGSTELILIIIEVSG